MVSASCHTLRRACVTFIWRCLLPFGAAAQSLFADSLLCARLDSIVQNKLPAGSLVGVSVYDLTSNRILYEHDADVLCRPASVMKLLTAVSALEQPEASEPFRTEVWSRGELRGDTLVGDLYIVGAMDPELTHLHLDTLASQLPFKVLTGRVLGDVSMTDSLYWGNGWLWDDNPSAFQPYMSPLMINRGAVSVNVRPAAAGQPGIVELTPPSSYYTFENRTKSQQRNAGTLRLDRDWLTGGNHLVLSGNVTGRRELDINVSGPGDFLMHVWREKLAERISLMQPGYAYEELVRDSAATLLSAVETPVAMVLNQMLKESENLNAEAMLRRLAVQATGHRHVSAEDGLEAVRATLRRAGQDPARYRLSDGSGLSIYNMVSPSALVAVLRYAQSQPDLFSMLYEALPIGGVDGTLKNRLGTQQVRGRVHAKTGSMSAVSTLAGYIQTRSGHLLCFAIMNQNQLRPAPARALQDALCSELVGL